MLTRELTNNLKFAAVVTAVAVACLQIIHAGDAGHTERQPFDLCDRCYGETAVWA